MLPSISRCHPWVKEPQVCTLTPIDLPKLLTVAGLLPEILAGSTEAQLPMHRWAAGNKARSRPWCPSFRTSISFLGFTKAFVLQTTCYIA